MTRTQEIATLLVLCAIQVTHTLDFTMVMPLSPQLMRTLEISPTQFGLILSSYTFAAGLSAILGSGIVDRFDRKSVLLSLFIGFSIGTIGCMMATSYVALLFARVLSGFFGGVLSATILAVVGDAFPVERRGWATGIVMTSFSVSSVLGIPLSLGVANRWGWNASFGLLAVICIAVFPIALFGMPKMRGHLKSGRAHPMGALAKMGSVIRNRVYQQTFAFTTVLVLAGFAIIPFISPSLVSNAGIAERDLQYVYIVGGLATFFTAQLVGRMVDRFGAQRMFLWTALISLIPIYVVTHLSVVPMAFVLAMTTFFMIFFNARWVAAMTLVNRGIQPQDRGAVMNLNSSVQSIFSGIGALIASAMVSRDPLTQRLLGFNHVGWFGITMTLLCVVASQKLMKPRVGGHSAGTKPQPHTSDSSAPPL